VALTIAFFVTAVIYGSVGFGGGSTYSALLLSSAVPVAAIPFISLPCNIIVSGTGFLRMRKKVPGTRMLRLLLVSMPAALVGGTVPVTRDLFQFLLAVVLLLAGILSVLRGLRAGEFRTVGGYSDTVGSATLTGPVGRQVTLAGGIIGFVSGIVGIGGGILLSPVLQREQSVSPGEVTAMSATFILFNSLSGLTGKILRALVGGTGIPWDYRTLILAGAVVFGGVIGSTVAVRGLPAQTLRVLTGALLVLVAVRSLLIN